MEANQQPIGIFDSGVGGITILQAIRQLMPHENLAFVADQAHVPYGMRPIEEIQAFAEGIVQFLLTIKAKTIVVACNTASAAALHYLREIFPQVPIVGMEPAIKPAVQHTRSGVIGVLATQTTFQGALYASLVERFTNGVTILQEPCIGLVPLIEKGAIDTPETRKLLENILKPMLENRMDTVVLGCTHYPFVTPIIREIVGNDAEIIDPAFAVARQTQRVLEQNNLINDQHSKGQLHFYTTNSPRKFSKLIQKLPVHEDIKNLKIKGLLWKETSIMAWELQQNNSEE